MLFDDILTVDSPEDLMLDKEADELEDAEDDVISNDGSDIDMIADITDDDIIAAEVDALDRGESDEDDEDDDDEEEEEYEEEHYYRENKDEDDDDEYEDYDVDEDDDDEEKENHHHWGDKHNHHKHWGDRHHEEEDD